MSSENKKKKNNTNNNKNINKSKDIKIEEIKEEKVNIEENELLTNDVKKKEIYVGFYTRFLILLISFIVCFVVSFLLIMQSFSIISEKTIDYQEKSNIDYRVYLKPNEFYDVAYLEEDMVYVSSLIKNIETDFKYKFNISEKSNIKFDYEVVGELSIVDTNGTKTFFKKEYTLLEDKDLIINEDNEAVIDETVEIDYGYYNNLANKYRQEYGINSQSYFIVSLKVNKTSTDETIKFDKDSVMSLRIPLAQNEVNIKIDSNELNNSSNVISSAMLEVDNIIFIVLGIITMGLSIVLFVKIIKYMFILIPKYSAYDKVLGKILKEYDRFIVETTTAPDKEKFNVVRVDKFVELLDVRDNLSRPIKYYNITKHQKCVFYINHDNEIYIYTLKAVDLDETE